MADYDIGSAFAQIEDELIASMTRNLKRHTVEEAVEGYEWAQWQALQLQALEDYKRRAAAKYGAKFSSINDKIEESITASYNTAQTQQEKEILRQIHSGIPETVSVPQGTASVTGEFFKTNDRKLEALVKATTNDMKRAETAVLRMTNDKYRSIIFNAQVYANTGAGTYKKAVDMATKDFLAAGINCIEYKNGRRVNIKSYAEMALRTANKRAYLQGEGEMRKKWGIHTVILNKRTNACPKCSRFVGQVIVDDVWSGGTAQEAQKGGYLLMSECINEGLYHPNCQDSHTTYFGDILDDDEEPQEEQGEQEEPDTGDEQEPKNEQSKPAEQTFTSEEQQLNEQLYQAQQRENYCERQTERFERLSKYSLDEDNQRIYRSRANNWKEKLKEIKRLKEEFIFKFKSDPKQLLYRKHKLSVSQDTITLNRSMRGQNIVKAKRVSNSKHDLYVSTIANCDDETLRFYDKKITEIEQSIKFKTSGMKKPRYVIVNGDSQMSINAIASYDPVTNTMYLRDNTNSIEKMILFQTLGGANSVTCSENPNSSITHEFMHWYRFKYAKKLEKITGVNQKEILQKSQEEVLAFLMKSNYNIREELGNYASSSIANPATAEEVVVELLTAYHCSDRSDDTVIRKVIKEWFNDRV